mgnify:CR=1 FL=1|jgi:hypothetical protein
MLPHQAIDFPNLVNDPIAMNRILPDYKQPIGISAAILEKSSVHSITLSVLAAGSKAAGIKAQYLLGLRHDAYSSDGT